MVREYSLALTASAQRLSQAFTNPQVGGPEDFAYRQVFIRAGGAQANIGGSAVTSSTGRQIASGGEISFGPFETGPFKLSDLYGVGSGATLYIVGIPF